jgi:hypothetical protein
MIYSHPLGSARSPQRQLLRIGLVFAPGAVADVPDVAVRVGEGTAVSAPFLGGGGLEDRGAGVLGFRQDLVDPLLAADRPSDSKNTEMP